MYSEDDVKAKHLKDFERVLKRLEKDPSTNSYRLQVIKTCIRNCKND